MYAQKLPRSSSVQYKIWMAETREDAHSAFDSTLKRFAPKYPRAMECLAKDHDALLAF